MNLSRYDIALGRRFHVNYPPTDPPPIFLEPYGLEPQIGEEFYEVTEADMYGKYYMVRMRKITMTLSIPIPLFHNNMPEVYDRSVEGIKRAFHQHYGITSVDFKGWKSDIYEIIAIGHQRYVMPPT